MWFGPAEGSPVYHLLSEVFDFSCLLKVVLGIFFLNIWISDSPIIDSKAVKEKLWFEFWIDCVCMSLVVFLVVDFISFTNLQNYFSFPIMMMNNKKWQVLTLCCPSLQRVHTLHEIECFFKTRVLKMFDVEKKKEIQVFKQFQGHKSPSIPVK